MRMYCVEQQPGAGSKLLSDSQCDEECTFWSCRSNVEQGRRSQQKILDKTQLQWKYHIFIHNLTGPLRTGMLDVGRFISQWLRNNSHQQDNRYKLEDAESRVLCREESELSRSWTGKSA